MYAVSGEHAPEALAGAKRRELLDMVKSEGLVFSALCGDLGKGFHNPGLNPELIEKSKRILDLAKEDCQVFGIQEHNESLESYFMGLVGGGEHE